MPVQFYDELLTFFVRAVRDAYEARELAWQSVERVQAAVARGERIDDVRHALYEVARELLIDRHQRRSSTPFWRAVGDWPAADRAWLRAAVAIGNAQASAAWAASAARGERQREQRHERRRRVLAGIIALTLVAGASTGAWWRWQSWQSQSLFSRHYAADRDQRLDVALPDGSEMVLDAESSAQVTWYRNRRIVTLSEGQALFRVRADHDRPFDVLAGATRVSAVGTQFSVRYTPSLGEDGVQVAVDVLPVRTLARETGGL